MLAIETNVMVRLLARDDVKQAKAADQFVAKGAWVSHLVLAETMWVLESVYERTNIQIVDALKLLLAHESLVLQDADVVAGAVTQLQSKSSLRFSDCLVLEIARKAGHLPLGSFDKALAKLDGVKKM